MNTESAGGLIINEKNEIILVFEEDFKGWILPKGHIEKGENKEQTSIREVREETGLKIEPEKYLGTITRKEFGTGKTKIIHCYLYKIQKKPLKKGAKWFPKNETIENTYFKEEKEFIKKHLNNKKRK